jgi:hypothetical protein
VQLSLHGSGFSLHTISRVVLQNFWGFLNALAKLFAVFQTDLAKFLNFCSFPNA